MKQKEALEILKRGKNVFLTGEPGAGKTYLINQFTDWLKGEGIDYAITASTGIAATHVNGTTIHSWSGIGIKKTISDNHIQNLMYNEFVYDRVNEADVLIVDEVSMLDGTFINNLDYVMCKLRGEMVKAFGGIQIVFVGDFFQLPPVSKDGEPMFAFEAGAWKRADLQICYLTEQHRQTDPVFTGILTSLRNGTITEDQKNILRACQNGEKHDTHLFTHNGDVDYMNWEKLKAIDAPEHDFRMSASGVDFLIKILKQHVLSPEILVLKEGALVMFTRNNFDAGYVNGTIGTVVGFAEDTGHPIIETMDGRTIAPGRAEWSIEEHGVTKASVTQFPLRLAWAMTVHKSQGMSLDEATIDLSRTFEYGQGYVAISRVRSLDGLFLEGINHKAFAMHPKVIEYDAVIRKLSTDNGTVPLQ